DLSEIDLKRMERGGIGALSEEQGLRYFDAALASENALAVAIRTHPAGLRGLASAGALPSIMRGLVRVPRRRAAAVSTTLLEQLGDLSGEDRERAALDLVLAQVAAVLGHESAAAIDPGRAFQELGFDSLAAVELRNRLAMTTGLSLQPTIVFDYPSAEALTTHLLAQATASAGAPKAAIRATASDEPIAIVGMACRFPGGAGSPEELWKLVSSGGDGIGSFPEDRGWELDRLDDLAPSTGFGGKGGFVEDASRFDAAFFGIGPREAQAMDPQQRLLLEAAWETLESAGIDPSSLRGSQTGVFAGAGHSSYGGAEALLSGYGMTGSLTSVLSGRVAYTLGLEGPAMTVDTACSSSLVAMHLAAQALRQGECSLALAGGVTVFATPFLFAEFGNQGGLSPDGRCKAFADAADGTGFSEGTGMLALERVSDAERNGHRILATIRGSAVNQDGASNGLTAPNGPSQERVIRQALANARLEPKDVDAVEAHGTGTTLGDPIEAGALLATYGQDRERPLKLGSIKSNIGHTQAAAGVAGVIKMVMAMREGVLPKTLHLDAPSSKVDWSAGEIELLQEPEPWEPNGGPRRAGVSSFGISGTNAHLILEEAPAPAGVERSDEREPFPGPIPLALSAKSEPALQESAARLAAHIEANPELDPTDIAYSLATTRTPFEQRAVALGADREELLGGLKAVAAGGGAAAVVRGIAASSQRPAFLFPGQGAQWEGMGLELLESSPLFAARIDECEAALEPHVDWSLREVLGDRSGAWMDRLDMVQPILFATMVSLAALWRARGVEPAVVIGHSQGEIAAAHVAGALSLDDAARVVALRAKAMASIAGQGGMVSLLLPAAEVESLLEPHGERISLAALNGPSSQIVSGDPEALEELLQACEEKGVRAKRIAVDYAAHSAQIEPLKRELLEAFAPISPRQGEIPFHSTLTGEKIDTSLLDAEYWFRNLREPVRLEPVVRSLLEQGQRTFVEIGPHPVLALPLQETAAGSLDGAQATVLGTLRRGDGGIDRFVRSLAEAHVAGASPDWSAFFKGSAAQLVPLPTYPFQRERFWLSGDAAGLADPTAIGQAPSWHPLLGAAIEDPRGDGLTLTGRLSLSAHSWLADRTIFGTSALPGAAFLEMALHAAERVGAEQVEELTLRAPLALPERGAVQLQVSVAGPDEEGQREIAIHSRPEGGGGDPDEAPEWICNATGRLAAEAPLAPEPAPEWPPEGAETLDVDWLYERLADLGLEYGGAFHGLRAAWRDGEEILAEVSLADAQRDEAGRFAVHPALLELAQAALGLLDDEQGLSLPSAWGRVVLHAAGAEELRVRLRREGEEISLQLSDPAGALVAQVGSLETRPISPDRLRGAEDRRHSLLGVDWTRIDLSAPEPSSNGASSTTFATLGELAIPGAERHESIEALLESIGGGAAAPMAVLCELRAGPSGQRAEAARALAQSALETVQGWLAREELSGSRLAFLTSGAVSPTGEETPELAAASLWGLLRSAQSEHPGRFALIDSDRAEASDALLSAALEQVEEPQLALRAGEAAAPRLAAVPAPDERVEERGPGFDPDRTSLITGATSGLGALVARHLAEQHGARHLLLVSRSGPSAEGAAKLCEELEALGAEARIEACDVSDRSQLEALIESISEEHPLGAVVHAAGALDDGTIESLGSEQLERVFAPKADAAWYLHELTAGMELEAFVTFSSVAGVLGGAGQGNYAAANAFLDALAQRRHTEGLPATSIAWGLWETTSAMTAGLEEADLKRMERGGIGALSQEQGLRLFDRALRSDLALAVAIRTNSAGLRSLASVGILPPLLRRLVRAPRRRAAASVALLERLATLSSEEREQAVLDLVRSQVAAVLGHESGEAIDPSRAFQDLGFDSLAAVELRNRLAMATAMALPPTLVFDYPTAEALAAHLLAEALQSGGSAQVAVRAAQSSEEPIAILGMSCRYPGRVRSAAGLWALVAEGRDGIVPFPDDRGWALGGSEDLEANGGFAPVGGFVDGVGDFDAEFFGIGPREALAMDPQQRLLLEAAWEALEDAGIDPTSLRGSPTGVFAGAGQSSYGGIETMLGGYGLTGTSASVLSGRVSYVLGLEGPAMTVDTACSSSLVSLHLAAQALRQGECSLALAGGVAVLATPFVFAEFGNQGGLSQDGRCKPFAEAADGTGWAEGVGMLALERLSDAERNGHPILATIRGSAVNQDGASNGLTAPNGPSQERVIRQALANARLEPKDVDAVEAHGTGTTLGDPIEAGALLATYGQERERPLKLGAIKSNIGHSQAAAGVAGVIKMVMAMREGVLPQTLHVDAPSSKVDWSAGEIELLREAEPWEANGGPRRAGVSAFGISGTNAHLILEEAPAPATVEAETPERAPLPTPIPLVLSAKSEPALRESAARLATHIEENPGLDPADLACSLATTRSHFERRAVALGAEREEMLGALRALSQGEGAPNLLAATARPTKLAYLFSGQGSQRQGMGKQLYESHPAYAAAFDRACEALEAELKLSLKEIVFSEEEQYRGRLNHTSLAQPAIFATEVALARALASQGLEPDLLAGHSIGEIAAAHVAGVLSLEDAAKLIGARATLMGALPEGGAMLAVSASEAEAEAAIEGKETEIAIAAVNSPSSVVLSGTAEAIEAAGAHFDQTGAKTKRLEVSHAFHSPLMEPMLEEFADVAKTLTFNGPKIPIVSNVSGEMLSAERATDPAYWVSQVRQPVHFAQATETLSERGAATFLEIGPEPVLVSMAQETLEAKDSEGTLIPTLRSGRSEPDGIARAIATAHASGAKLDWGTFFKGTGAKRIPLPTYPFQRQRYWTSSTMSALSDPAAVGQAPTGHPLLGAAVEIAGEEGGNLLLTGRLSLATHSWLADHSAMGTVLLPGTAFLELALHAAGRAGAEQVSELILQAPLVLPEAGALQLQVSVEAADEEGQRQIAIHSRPESGEEAPPEWTCHATGLLSDSPVAPAARLTEWPPPGAEPIEVDSLYEQLADAGLDYGPAFQGLTAAWRDGEEILAEVSLADAQREEAQRFAIHPALLDAALHAAALSGDGGATGLPFSWSEVGLQAGGPSELRVRLRREGEGIGLELGDSSGAPIARVGSLRTRAISAEQVPGARPQQDPLLGIEWSEVELPVLDPSSNGASPTIATIGELELDGVRRFETIAALAEAIDSGEPAPQAVLLRAGADTSSHRAEAARALAENALGAAQEWLSRESLSGCRLAFVTTSAVAAGDEECPEPVAASLWGLVRSAQAEHPGRFALIDVDGSETSDEALVSALVRSEDSQLALRTGRALAPRLTRLTSPSDEEQTPAFDPERTILITGAGSGLGALIARHLEQEHGLGHLLLVDDRDASDRERLRKLLDSIDVEHPLGAVIHTGGTLDDGTVETLDAEQVGRVFAPKVDAAWHLHELTKDLELQAFVTFSSVTGTLGAPGQANYAAANAFLDALAQARLAAGLPATSIAWGLWAEQDMARALDEADLKRLERSGLRALSDEEGLRFLDLALAAEPALVLAVRPDAATLRSLASVGVLPPILSGLVRGPRRRAGLATAALLEHLGSLSEQERERTMLDLVRGEVAAVLGHESGEAIDPGKAFQDLGFDSLAAVELRNRLAAVTGMSLQPTLVFDYPTAEALAAHLLAELTAGGTTRRAVVRATASDEPIAIVGIGCRYPGGIASADDLWELVAAGGDGIVEFPADRGWNMGAEDGDGGAGFAPEGGFIDVAGFDAPFFGISPREALATDPQQRLLLEASWEALEDAGIDPEALRGSQTGVFAGGLHSGYGGLEAALAGFGLTSGTVSALSGRISYTLGLEGPAISVDTACSSSLVALHLASQALRAGECSLALAGGVTVLATPLVLLEFSRQSVLAADGRCKSFAEAADGTSWAEGVGILALERLSDAERGERPILGIIRGSAVNQDGASNGMTAPNGPSQERVIRQALANARLEPRDVDAVEAHGTGTTLGDPIEAGALLATYGQERDQPLRLGSIKSNIGHAQAAAGVAGVIKMVMAMREGVLPKTLHLDAPSSKVDWSAGEIELLGEQQPWEPNGGPRRAGISAFGATGTNAHLILEEAPVALESGADGEGRGRGRGERQPLPSPLPLVLSAKSEPALREAAARLRSRLGETPDLDPTDLAYSLATTRSTFAHRAVALGGSREQLLDALTAVADGLDAAGIARGRAARSQAPAFLFPGQGSQWRQMALGLREACPLFGRYLDECEAALEPHVDWSLREILADPDGAWLDRLDVVQPALFATMISLAKLWRACGVEPAVVVGHSQGEIAAAHVAGGLGLDDAARVVALRARAMAKLAGEGGMVSLLLPPDRVQSLTEPYGERISIAALNGPASVVVSGEPAALDDLLVACEAGEMRAQRVAVDYAAHSVQIEALKDELLEAFAPISPRSGEIPMHSTLTGELLDTSELDAGYWYRNLRETVRLEPAIRSLLQQGQRTFLEIGPHPVLALPVQETAEATLDGNKQATVLGTLRRDEGGPERFMLSFAEAQAVGVAVDWSAFFKGSGAKRVPLPTYPFQRERFWLSGMGGISDPSAVGQTPTGHPVLGAAVELAGEGGEGLLLTGRLSRETHPWLADRAVFGTVLVPGSVFLELALHAAARSGCAGLEELTLREPLVLPERGAVQLQVSVDGDSENGERRISIHSRLEGGGDEVADGRGWICHAVGRLGVEAPPAPDALPERPPEGAEPLDVDLLYDRLADLGLEYGAAFQGLAAAWREGEEIVVEVSLAEPQREEAERFVIHPVLLDAALHAATLSAVDPAPGDEREAPVAPSAWHGVRLYGAGASAIRLKLGVDAEGARTVLAVDRSGAPLLQVESVVAQAVDRDRRQADAFLHSRSLYRREWVAHSLPPADTSGVRLAVLGGVEIDELEVDRYADLPALLDAIEKDAAVAPDAVLVEACAEDGERSQPERARLTAEQVLVLVKAWIGEGRLER
ncbi:MAG TPA: SDR family NAD(P)-dependent oxidoreductase, partial [Solirubrobacterales bacterium]